MTGSGVKMPRAGTLSCDWQRLESNGWLASRPQPLRSKLRALARLRRFGKKEPVFLAGDSPSGLFGIASGSVHVALPREDGLDFTACRLGVGVWIGTHTLADRHTHLESVWAAEETRAIHLPAHGLRRVVCETPAFHEDFSDLAYETFGFVLRILASFSEEDVNNRVARRLMMELDGRGDAEGWIALSQPEFAEMLAISLPTLQRCLRRLVSRDCIRIGYSRIQVVDRGALEALDAPLPMAVTMPAT